MAAFSKNINLDDASVVFVDTADQTKKLAFQCSGITTSTTRTLTIPDADFTIPTSSGMTWTDVTGTSQAAAINNGYIANNVALVTVTIPTTAAVGDVVRVVGYGAGGWKVAQNASEIIHFLSIDTTTGAGGSLASTNHYDAVELICVVANTEWAVISSVGNITIV